MPHDLRPSRFFSIDETDRLTQAIRDVEARSSGQVRVYLEWRCPITDPLSRAIQLLEQLNLHKLQDRNAVLIYFATQHRLFSIVADVGVSRKVSNEFWRGLRILMEHRFSEDKFLDGTLLAIEQMGWRLLQYFPKTPKTKR